MEYWIIVDWTSWRMEKSWYKEKSFKIFEDDWMEFLFEHSCKYFFTKKVPVDKKNSWHWSPDYYIEVFVTWGECSEIWKWDYEYVRPIRTNRISPLFYKEDEVKEFCKKCFFNSFTSVWSSYENLEEFIWKLEMWRKERIEENWEIFNSDIWIIFSWNFSKVSWAFNIRILDRWAYFDRFLNYLIRWWYKITRISNDLKDRCRTLNIVPKE